MADSRLNEHPNNDAESNSTPACEMVYCRAPIITPFLVTGGIFGVLVAFSWGGFAGGPEDYTQLQTVALFSIGVAIVRIAIGALVWLMVDRWCQRNTDTIPGCSRCCRVRRPLLPVVTVSAKTAHRAVAP